MSTFAEAPAGDVAAGEKVGHETCQPPLLALATCTLCHVAEKGGGNKQGPNLGGLFGRTTGSIAGFAYSKANKEANVTWGEETL
eukprot:364444-Chlamydomonas_euryale.AAC.3